MTHSLGGGTGSGLGSHILQQLEVRPARGGAVPPLGWAGGPGGECSEGRDRVALADTGSRVPAVGCCPAVCLLRPCCVPACVQEADRPLSHTHVLALAVQDEYPAAQRFAVSVFPSADDDVVTSPYNALLSLQRLAEHADAVLPLENAALLAVCASLEGRRGGGGGGGGGGAAAAARPGGAAQRGAGSGWEGPNALAASVLLDLTASGEAPVGGGCKARPGCDPTCLNMPSLPCLLC